MILAHCAKMQLLRGSVVLIITKSSRLINFTITNLKCTTGLKISWAQIIYKNRNRIGEITKYANLDSTYIRLLLCSHLLIWSCNRRNKNTLSAKLHICKLKCRCALQKRNFKLRAQILLLFKTLYQLQFHIITCFQAGPFYRYQQLLDNDSSSNEQMPDLTEN